MSKALFLNCGGVISRGKNYLYSVKHFDFTDIIFDVSREFQRQDY